MFNRARAIKPNISLVDSHGGYAKAANSVETASVEPSVAQGPAVPEPVVPEIEIGTLKMKPLLERVTREQVITALLACISIGALFLFWYLGTKYRVELYIRFKNVPTPYEVFR